MARPRTRSVGPTRLSASYVGSLRSTTRRRRTGNRSRPVRDRMMPQTPFCKHERDHDRDDAERDRVPRDLVLELLAEQVVEDRPDHRALDRADATDHDDEDDRRGPLHDAERRTDSGRLDPDLAQVERRAGQRRPERGDRPDREPGAVHVRPEAPRSSFVVADGLHPQTESRTEDDVAHDDRADAGDEREPVRDVLPRREVVVGHLDRRSAAAADARVVDHQEAAHLGEDPGADREVAPPQTERDQPHRDRHDHRRDRRDHDGEIEIEPLVVDEHDHAVGAETDEGLLADGHDPGEPGQQVPHLGEGDQREQLDHLELRRRLGERRQQRQDHDRHERDDAEDPARRRGAADHERGRQSAIRSGHAWTFPNMPVGRVARTARNTAWPVSSPHCELYSRPRAWATPSVIPPASVPHNEPRPPMITASNA